VDIKKRLSELKEKRKADYAMTTTDVGDPGGATMPPSGVPPKPTSDPGPNMKWVLNRKTNGWEARPMNDPNIYEAIGSVKPQWEHYASEEDSLFVAAQWDPKDENNMDWDASTVRKEVLAFAKEKYGKEAKIHDLDWESGIVLLEVKQAKRAPVKEVYAELKGECVTCPIDDSSIEVNACRGAGGEPCPFYLKREASELCSFKKLGTNGSTSLDQYISEVHKKETIIKIANMVLNVSHSPKKASKQGYTIPKDENYVPVTRLATVERLGHKGQVMKKNADGSFKVKWEDGNEGVYWSQELTAK
jgi:hypothetical protein